MKKVLLASCVLLSLVSIACKESGKKAVETENPDQKIQKLELKDFVGKTFEFNYKEKFVYQIKFESDSMVKWKLVRGDFPGPKEETDPYIYSQISDHVVFISWVEKSGLGFSNILDFSTGKLTTHARQENSVHINPGKFKVIE
ncbi:phenolic acid decarboxylase [Chryseobacterium timonianum]|uniref:phenolic acid decarboxylase n=1 Tax=Chryseobacterium timonianum TaxID=1805473 RepID=UPI00083ACB8A|nr:hypothetical protein [Chryseobacterium timonianum]